MPDHNDRDARRWAAYERLVSDPAASPSEQQQARAHLDALRQRYPQGLPQEQEGGEDPFQAWAEELARVWSRMRAEPQREDPRVTAAKAAAERQAQEEAVRRQRADVERVPGWDKSGVLQELHARNGAWSREEQQLFRDARVRLTGSSRAVDL